MDVSVSVFSRSILSGSIEFTLPTLNLKGELAGSGVSLTILGKSGCHVTRCGHASLTHVSKTRRCLSDPGQYVSKPVQINQLECELGVNGCSNAPYLLHFGMYIDALKAREAVLVPRYSQLHHRKLCRKRHIETQRFESRFIRDGSRRRNRVDNSRK